MISFALSRPDDPHLRAVRDLHAEEPYSYDAVGRTRSQPPSGWALDRQEGVLGSGERIWERTREAIDRWRMFDQPWIHLVPDGPPEAGRTVVFASQQLGVWVTNLCRVVYVIDEQTPHHASAGFAYGTLATHAVQGEEQFLATWNRQTDAVRFSVYKFSRIRDPLVQLFTPVARRVQDRFSAGAIQAMQQAVQP